MQIQNISIISENSIKQNLSRGRCGSLFWVLKGNSPEDPLFHVTISISHLTRVSGGRGHLLHRDSQSNSPYQEGNSWQCGDKCLCLQVNTVLNAAFFVTVLAKPAAYGPQKALAFNTNYQKKEIDCKWALYNLFTGSVSSTWCVRKEGWSLERTGCKPGSQFCSYWKPLSSAHLFTPLLVPSSRREVSVTLGQCLNETTYLKDCKTLISGLTAKNWERA